MSFAQEIDVSKEPRPATPQEETFWNEFLREYDKLTQSTKAFMSTVQVAADLQTQAYNKKLPLIIFDNLDQASVESLLARYNTIGRLIAGCDQRKYWADFSKGDVAIVAPPGMAEEEYTQDIYPGAIEPELGLAPLVVIGLIGVALITGALTTVKILDYKIRAKDKEFQEKVLEADIDALKLPKPQQTMWLKIKEASSDLIREANKEHKEESWFQKLLRSGVGGAVGAGLVIGGLLLAFYMAKRRQSK